MSEWLPADWLFIVFFIAIVVLILLPPKYDPSIRWKERNERKDD